MGIFQRIASTLAGVGSASSRQRRVASCMSIASDCGENWRDLLRRGRLWRKVNHFASPQLRTRQAAENAANAHIRCAEEDQKFSSASV